LSHRESANQTWEGILIQAVGSRVRSAGLLIAKGIRASSRRSFAAMMHMVHHGGLDAVVRHTFELDEVAKAHEVMTGRHDFGKLVLRVP
jgi:NADPH:quinone reductase-like Zn-dependent oxidoreductase